MSKLVRIRQNTYEELEQAKAKGQSFDGKIRELMENEGLKVEQ